MIRLYFDWNALVHLKNGLQPELDQLLAENKHRFHIFYSTAHIGDIYKGYKTELGLTKEIENDLKYIGYMTSNLCFVPSSTVVSFDEYDPLELFEDRIASEELAGQLFMGFPNTQSELSDNPFGLFHQAFKMIPLPSLEGQESELKDIFPETKSDNTFHGLFQGVISLFKDLNTTDRYKGLRKQFQSGMGINRDQIYNHATPFKKLDLIIKDSALAEGNFEDMIKKIAQNFNNGEMSWFDEISNTYISLDMSGYKEDKIEVTPKKTNTFKNTIEDSFHTAFASQVEIYITNDDRNYHKAKAVYEKLNINTKVFTTAELYEFLSNTIYKEKTISFIENIVDRIKTGQGYVEDEKSNFITYFFTDYVLDYFNKAYYIFPKENEGEEKWTIILTKEKPTNGRYTFIKDIDMLIAKLIQLFGIPFQNKLTLSPSEVKQIQEELNWEGRRWFIGNLLIKFISINGYFQLYIYPVSQEPDNLGKNQSA